MATLTIEDTARIQSIVDRFDYAPVRKYMTKTDWKWVHMEGPDRVPNIAEMKDTVKGLIKHALEGTSNDATMSTGGFEVVKSEDMLEIRFIPWSRAYIL